MSDFEFWKDLGNIFDAIVNYQKKNVEFNNRFINPWIRLGNIFDRDDQHKEAVQAYRQAIELDPQNAQNWAELGDVLFKMAAYEEAVVTYQKAVELDPKAGWPISNLALCMVTLGHYEEGIHLYLTSLDLLPDDKDKAVSWNRLGNAYRKLNDYENAFLAFQKADELDGDNTGFRDQLDETTETNTMVAPEDVLMEMEIEGAGNGETAMEELVDEEALLETQPPTDLETGPAALTEEAPALDIAETEVPVEIQAADAEVADIETVREARAAEQVAAQEATDEQAAETADEHLVRVESPAMEAGVNWPPADIDEHRAEPLQTESEPLPAWLADEKTDAAETESVAEENADEFAEIDEPVAQVVEEIIAWSHAQAAAAEAAPEVEKPIAVEVEVTVNTSTTSTELAETYTEFTSTPVMIAAPAVEDTQPIKTLKIEVAIVAEDSFSEEPAAKSATESEVQEEVGEVMHEIVISEVPEESVQQSGEAAYEEYLKDAVDPLSTLSDHIDDVHAPAPETRVSETGEVRIAMDTENAHVWNELGNVYFNSGACDDAIAAYGRAIELDRQFAWPYSNLALAYVQKNRFAEAILLYQRSIELFATDKDKAVTWNRLGNVYRRLNDYSNAITAYQTADDLDPDNATLSLRSHYGLLGNLYNEQKPNYVS